MFIKAKEGNGEKIQTLRNKVKQERNNLNWENYVDRNRYLKTRNFVKSGPKTCNNKVNYNEP